MAETLYLGLDLSTQSLTAVVIDPLNKALEQHTINFDSAYPAYHTAGGIIIGHDPTVVHTDPRMWAEALDDMLAWLKKKTLSSKISAIGVSAQQHGSVYLNQDAAAVLSHLDPSRSLLEQIQIIFSRSTCPVWMDSSTNDECSEITEALAGDVNVSQLTGSKATERFAGPQIRKFWKNNPQHYNQTTHIALISSFITSLLIGRIAPLDTGDGFGTNLANIHTVQWSERALAATAPNLRNRLPNLIQKDEAVGTVSGYLVKRYAFRPQTKVVVGSGDNPCSLVGLGLIGEPMKRGISLGTSDTIFGYMPRLMDIERSEGHIFGVADGNYMSLLCFKNASLAREEVKNTYNLSWREFSEILLTTPSGNNGKIMLPYFLSEITPLILNPRVFRFGGLTEDEVKGNVRAIAEAQIMAMYLHSDWFGKRPQTILVTAGGSGNLGLLKIISQVFDAEVRSFEVQDSAALGAAIRAAHWFLNNKKVKKDWKELADLFIKGHTTECISPAKDEVEIYHGENGLLGVYESCEKFALGFGENPDERIRQFKKSFC